MPSAILFRRPLARAKEAFICDGRPAARAPDCICTRGRQQKTLLAVAKRAREAGSKGGTHYVVRLCLLLSSRALRCANVSPAKRASSRTSTLYRDTIIVSTATASVSENLSCTAR